LHPMTLRHKRHKLSAAVMVCVALWHTGAWAASDPNQELQTIEQKLEKATANQRELQSKERKLRKEMEMAQKELVQLAGQLRENEKALSKREREVVSIVKRSRNVIEDLQAHRQRTAASMSGMVRFSRMPPEAWIALPGTMNDALRAAIALRHVTLRLHDDAHGLREKVQELEALKTESEGARQALEEEKRNLEQSRRQLAQKLDERETLHRQLYGDIDKVQREISHLSARARSLRELIDTLENRRDKWQSLDLHPAKPKPDVERPAFATAPVPVNKRIGEVVRGAMLKPATGAIIAQYGDPEKEGAGTLQGIRIQTRDSAQVVAPFDGEVVYTGPFLSYGNMVIIRHNDEYHTLIAGLKAIHSEPGQFVLKGEPVGKMGRDTDGLTKLYVELRKNSGPVDPLPWFSG